MIQLTAHLSGPRLRSLARRIPALMTATMALVPALALAGGTATINASGPTGPSGKQGAVEMTVSWRDDMTRIDMSSPQGTYMLLRDSKSYTVTNQGGRIMVMDMGALGKMAKSMGQQSGGGGRMAPTTVKSVESFEPTGSTETVAGIEGEVYRVEWTDGNGDRHTDTGVFSEDPLAVELTGAFRRYVDGMGMGADDPFNRELVSRNLGALKFGDRYQVLSISDDTRPAAAFELPAEPMDLQKMMQMGQ